MNENEKYNTVFKKTVKTVVSFDNVLAIVISYTTWKLIFWAIIHGLFSWLYVIYYALFY